MPYVATLYYTFKKNLLIVSEINRNMHKIIFGKIHKKWVVPWSVLLNG